MIERMSEQSGVGSEGLAVVCAAGLIDVITTAAAEEARAAARRWAAIAELTTRRCGSEQGRERELWACDGWDSAAAEVAAALAVSHRAASTLLHQGLALRDRDLTCRFPGCDRPAERCDLDHRTPYGDRGATHPANLRCLCRKHHLLKTFWTGPSGWTDHQLDDGTIIWTAPTGHHYRSPPPAALHFPHCNTTTPTPPTPPTPPHQTAATPAPASQRALAMPQRKHPRRTTHTNRIHTQRHHNQHLIDTNPAPF